MCEGIAFKSKKKCIMRRPAFKKSVLLSEQPNRKASEHDSMCFRFCFLSYFSQYIIIIIIVLVSKKDLSFLHEHGKEEYEFLHLSQ